MSSETSLTLKRRRHIDKAIEQLRLAHRADMEQKLSVDGEFQEGYHQGVEELCITALQFWRELE